MHRLIASANAALAKSGNIKTGDCVVFTTISINQLILYLVESNGGDLKKLARSNIKNTFSANDLAYSGMNQQENIDGNNKVKYTY